MLPEVGEGLCFRMAKGERIVRWADVARVDAFNQAVGTYDDVCLELFDGRGRSLGVVGEEEAGFENAVAWVDTLRPRFGDWFHYVVHPPFNERRVTIWAEGEANPWRDSS